MNSPSGRNWYALLHLGVMRMEHLDERGAEEAWLESIRLEPSAWAHRNLAVLYLRQKDETRALEHLESAWALISRSANPPAALAVEFLRILAAAGKAQRGMDVYRSLPTHVQQIDRIQLLRGQLAIQANDLEAVEQVLSQRYSEIREGETTLSDLWFELQARREAERTGRPLDEMLREEVRVRFPPPAHIDFRISSE